MIYYNRLDNYYYIINLNDNDEYFKKENLNILDDELFNL